MATIPYNKMWINFINEYKNLRELWDSKCDSYKNEALKTAAYKKLTKVYKKIDKNANIQTVKGRIKNMRSSYKRELKKQIASEKSGAGTDDLYVPNLWYFNEFEFLKEFEMPDDGWISRISADKEGVSVTPPKSAKRKIPPVNYDRNELLQKATMHLENLSHKEERDEADIYGDGWAHSYRKLSTEQKLFAKNACDEIFFLGQHEKLTLNSVRTDTLEFSPPHRSSSCSSLPQYQQSDEEDPLKS